MDSELIIVCAVQVFVLFLVLGLILVYLYKNLMIRSRVDVAGRAVLITGKFSTVLVITSFYYNTSC